VGTERTSQRPPLGRVDKSSSSTTKDYNIGEAWKKGNTERRGGLAVLSNTEKKKELDHRGRSRNSELWRKG